MPIKDEAFITVKLVLLGGMHDGLVLDYVTRRPASGKESDAQLLDYMYLVAHPVNAKERAHLHPNTTEHSKVYTRDVWGKMVVSDKAVPCCFYLFYKSVNVPKGPK